MTLVVPFDAGPLSTAALARAEQIGTAIGAPVVAVTAVPKNNRAYARDHGWIEADAEYDEKAITDTLAGKVARTAPSATFETLPVGRNAPTGTIATRLRRFCRDRDADAVFVGSDGAGRVVRSLSSVGSIVGGDQAFDVVLVRSARSAEPWGGGD
jgi:nucleotide-binding universal stress UspA family protein